MTTDHPTSPYLRLAEHVADDAGVDPDSGELLAGVCRAFERAVGWTLEYAANQNKDQNADLMWSAPVAPGVGASLRLISSDSDKSSRRSVRPAPLADAIALAEGVARLWGEICALRPALVEREAELAASVPVVARPESPQRAAERLSAVLKSGAEAIGCQAAGLYLLDAGTTSLKLRAGWGLPQRKLLAPPRPLRGALADLEALLGHAVVLSEPAMFEYWRAPEPCGAAVCVPVSSPTTPLGTLWAFSHMTRDFSDEQTNLLEVVAGRIAAELEREVLLTDAREGQTERRQLASAGERQTESLPRIAPLVDGWRVAGRVLSDGKIGGAFFDWFTAGSRVALTLGTAGENGLAGALAAAELRSALRAQAPGLQRASQGLHCAHEVLWGMSAGSAAASAFCGLVEPDHDLLRFSAAGAVRVWLLEPSLMQALGDKAPRLGDPDPLSIVEISRRLKRKSAVLAYGIGGREPDPAVWDAIELGLRSALPGQLSPGTEPLADTAQAVLQAQLPGGLMGRDCALLVVQRS